MSRIIKIVYVMISLLVLLIIATIYSFLTRAPVDSALTLLRIAAAKCPGIPGGSGSGGPDYINITVDVGLVGMFMLFVLLTIKDMRRKRLRQQKDPPSDLDSKKP